MMEMIQQQHKKKTTSSQSHCWWFDSHNSPRRSPWLQSTLSELDEKTKAMLKLIEEDADSFAQRAEMYYKKRPQLISMVEDFYRAHRSLAEKYDQLKSDSGTRIPLTYGSPIIWSKYRSEKLTNLMDRAYDSYSDSYGAESDVEDPEHEDIIKVDKEPGKLENSFGIITELKENITSSFGGNAETMKLKEEIERLKKENKNQEQHRIDEVMNLKAEIDRLKSENNIQKHNGDDKLTKMRDKIDRLQGENKILEDQLMQKDEEKREVIRQLSMAIDLLNEENAKLRKHIPKKSVEKDSVLEFSKFRKVFAGMFRPKTTIVAL